MISGSFNIKFICLLILFKITSTFCLSADDYNSNFDFSGINRLWEIADILKENIEPSTSQWDSLFVTSGYAELIKREIPRETFQYVITLAYMPSKADEMDEMIQSNNYSDRAKMMLNTFVRADSLRDSVTYKINNLKSYPFTEIAMQKALDYLPEKTTDIIPQVSFLIWGLNSRGYDPVIIAVIDLFMIDEAVTQEMVKSPQKREQIKNQILASIMGHEFFHFYRSKKLELKFPEDDHPDSDIIWMINQIANEGIANQIDKPLFKGDGIFAKTEWAEFYRKEQEEQIDLMKTLDSLLVEVYKNPDKTEKNGKKILRLIPRSGHPTGYYMSNVIRQNSSHEALINVAYNPFQFFILYNESAKKDTNSYIFSELSIEYIKLLKSKYSNSFEK